MALNDTDNVFATKELIQPLVECQKSGCSDKVSLQPLFHLFYLIGHYFDPLSSKERQHSLLERFQ